MVEDSTQPTAPDEPTAGPVSPHQAALDILSGPLAGLGLFQGQLAQLENEPPGRYPAEDLAALRLKCAALERSITALRGEPSLFRAFEGLCELLGRTLWAVSTKNPDLLVCRLCGTAKPAHAPTCPVEAWRKERTKA